MGATGEWSSPITATATEEEMSTRIKGLELTKTGPSAWRLGTANEDPDATVVGEIFVTKTSTGTTPTEQTWSITFTENRGNVDMLEIKEDWTTTLTTSVGSITTSIVEFVRGASNEFTIEPKKATGQVVKDIQSADGFAGQDIFFTELWDNTNTIEQADDGTHAWISDQGIASYNPVRYEIQRVSTQIGSGLSIPSTSQFRLYLDLRTTRKDRVGGVRHVTPLINCSATALDMKLAIESMRDNLRVNVVRNDVNGGARGEYDWFITFVSLLGDLPPLEPESTSIIGSTGGTIPNYAEEIQKGVTEVQTITTSAAAHYIREQQEMTITATAGQTVSGNIGIAFGNTPTKYIDVLSTAQQMEDAIENLDAIQLEIQIIETFGGDPVPLNGEFTLTLDSYTTTALRFDSSAAAVKAALEQLHQVQTVNVVRTQKTGNNLYAWTVTFVTNLGNLQAMVPTYIGSLTGSTPSCTVTETQPGILINDVTVTKQSLPAAQGTSASAFLIEFLDPVGNVPNLIVSTDQLTGSTQALMFGKRDGASPIGGTFIVSMGKGSWVTTPSLDFDISALGMKTALEGISSIGEIDVMREDLGNGHRWTITFLSNLGNLNMMSARAQSQEIQSIQTMGGIPTPLGGTFTVSFGGHSTRPIPFDSSAATVKASLEILPTIGTIDVYRFGPLGDGKYRWDIYFRTEIGNLPLMIADGHGLTGTSASVTTHSIQDGNAQSLTGAMPSLANEEKVAGLPSYTGSYFPEKTATYQMAVRQLNQGGLTSMYYDNQWFMGSPSILRVDPTINFNWGSDTLTQYARDYVSVRWLGKIRPKTTEAYTLYLHVDDGAKLYIDHVLVLDLWEQPNGPVEGRVTLNLIKGRYHDVRLDYREERGNAFVSLKWKSFTVAKSLIPMDQLFTSSHVVGSPFSTSIISGAADYPHTTAYGPGLIDPIVGIPAKFTIQARDAVGENKTSAGRDSASDGLDGGDSFIVLVTSSKGTEHSVTPEYIGGGKYSVEYIPSDSGYHDVSVTIGGTDIYCGNGKESKCSPWRRLVAPGRTTHETSIAYGLGLTDAVAGDVGEFWIQARDAYNNNKTTGGEAERFQVFLDLQTASIPVGPNTTTIYPVTFRGVVRDMDDGTGRYYCTYTSTIQGSYDLRILYDGLQILSTAVGPDKTSWSTQVRFFSYENLLICLR